MSADMNAYMLRRYHAQRAADIAALGGQCVICGSTEGLEFDHINPDDKSFSLGKHWSARQERYRPELAKCQLLCKRHHIEKSSREQGVEHGGGRSGKRNCPCDPCKERKSEYNRHYKAQRRSYRRRSDAAIKEAVSA